MIPIEKTDWNAIRAEYIGGGISQRKLAKKHGVTYPALRSRADNEGWVELREEAERKAIARTTQRTAEAASSNAEIAARIKAKLLRKLEREIDALPDMIGSETRNSITENEYTAGGKGKQLPIRSKEVSKAYKLRDLTAAFKDLTGDMTMTTESVNPLLQSLYDLERRCRSD